jgi:AcrR family transcriptional regulator
MEDPSLGTRERIVQAAYVLLTEGGRDAVSTRSVSAAAGVQAPTIYRLFGDMRGLLDAVASHGFAAYLTEKTGRERADDPVEDLRRGWDLHVGFGVANPAVYTLIYGDPRPGVEPPAAVAAADVLRGLVSRVAEAGRLRMDVEQAARIIHSAGCGVTLTLIGMAPENRDPKLSELSREVTLAAVTTDAGAGPAGNPLVVAAVALKASLGRSDGSLSVGERGLLVEWLDRLSIG